MGKALRGVGTVLAVTLALFVGYLAYLQVSGNFHAVVAGEVYRAAQMDGQRLVRWKRDYDIASVLNLRGENTGSDWYETERAVADRLGIQHLDFRMSAAHALKQDEVQALLQIMRDAPKPLLIHCAGGADRTGLASALYLAGVAGGTEDAAEWQLSPLFGHVSLGGLSSTWQMDVTWEMVEPLLGFGDS